MKQRVTWLVVLALVAFVALSGCTPVVSVLSAVQAAGLGTGESRAAAALAPTATPTTTAPVAPLGSDGLLAALEGRLQAIYVQVNPSVVNIQVTQNAVASSSVQPQVPGSPFGPSTPQPQQGSGSGFVWDKQGHVVTNNHVVDGASQIVVVFSDGTAVPAKVVGTDPDSDLAVLKVDVSADKLSPVQVADSDQVKVGQLAVAIGNPFGLEGTMTVGFVSALGRSLPAQTGDGQSAQYTIPDIIQTDAPINPGNSGGVLVNGEGQVIGVTSAIESPVRANAGIGFAIPSAIVQRVVPALVENGRYEHTWIGIKGTTLTADLNTAMKLNSDQRGVLVIEVTSGSPAEKAGLKSGNTQTSIQGQQVNVGGDVIVAIDGQPVKTFEDVVAYLAGHTTVGQKITLSVLRQGNEEAVQLSLAARPQQQATQPQTQLQRRTSAGVWLGVVGMTLTSDIATAMNLPANQQGILVEQVIQGSPAEQAGLRASSKSVVINGQSVTVGGDVIVAANGQPTARMEDLRAILQRAQPGQEMTLALIRDGSQVQVSAKLVQRPAESSTPN